MAGIVLTVTLLALIVVIADAIDDMNSKKKFDEEDASRINGKAWYK
jgi:hypothetical protein